MDEKREGSWARCLAQPVLKSMDGELLWWFTGWLGVVIVLRVAMMLASSVDWGKSSFGITTSKLRNGETTEYEEVVLLLSSILVARFGELVNGDNATVACAGVCCWRG